MKTNLSFATFLSVFFLSAFLLAGFENLRAQPSKITNVVLVHGAFADGSSWKPVYDLLTKKGFHVSMVQNPLSSLQADVAATNSVIDAQDGPVILVGHSWGGTVITEAGENPKVAALVYLSAFLPDTGETAGQWVSAAPAAPQAGFTPPDRFGLVYFDPAKFHAGFAGDLSAARSNFMRDSQTPIMGSCFAEPVTHAAWKTKPSYAIVTTQDKALNPAIQRLMYQRAKAKITEVDASHLSMISKPEAVAKVIESAAGK